MSDWKEALIADCITLEIQRKEILDKDVKDVQLVKLRRRAEVLMDEIRVCESVYCKQLDEVDSKIQSMHNQLITKWDIMDKTFMCKAGIATIRTTRSLKIDSKEMLINILEKIGKLTKCIKSWGLTYLRKLADAGLFDDEKITHYDEKRSVIISGVKDGEGKDEE